MRLPGQSIGLICLLALLLAGGPTGLCAIWGATGVDHHHHEGQKSAAFFGESDRCEKDQPPCTETGEELPEIESTIPSRIQQQLAVPGLLVAILPALIGEFGVCKSHARAAFPLHHGSTVPGSPENRRAVLCRFLI